MCFNRHEAFKSNVIGSFKQIIKPEFQKILWSAAFPPHPAVFQKVEKGSDEQKYARYRNTRSIRKKSAVCKFWNPQITLPLRDQQAALNFRLSRFPRYRFLPGGLNKRSIKDALEKRVDDKVLIVDGSQYYQRSDWR